MNERPLSRILSRSYDHLLNEGIRVVTLRPSDHPVLQCVPSMRAPGGFIELNLRYVRDYYPEVIICLT